MRPRTRRSRRPSHKIPYKDPQKQREYVRNYQRKQRSKDGYSGSDINHEWKLDTAQDLKVVLESIINELIPSDLDLGVKGRVIAQLLTVGCKLLEVSDIERRLEALESRMLGIKP